MDATDRIINLDNSPRPAITLQIAGKSFIIRRVVTGVRQLYFAFSQLGQEYLKRVEALDKSMQEVSQKHDKGAEEEINRRAEELTEQIKQFAAEKTDQLLEIIELLLVKNGYGFEREWWIDNAEEADYKEFIMVALTKDSTGAKKNEGEN